MMYEAMQAAAKVNKAVVAHCEDNSLIYGGAMHQGKRSEELGIPGIPNICEAVQIARDVLLAEAAHIITFVMSQQKKALEPFVMLKQRAFM